MKTITNTKTITTEKGTVINMTTTSKRGFEVVKEISFCDGDNVEISKGREINETKTVLLINGNEYEGYFSTHFAPVILKGFYGLFSSSKQSVGLSEDKYNELNNVVESTKKEAEMDIDWKMYQERKQQAQKEENEYEANYKAVEKMMTLNGNTY